jgi:hypothetical protein
VRGAARLWSLDEARQQLQTAAAVG